MAIPYHIKVGANVSYRFYAAFGCYPTGFAIQAGVLPVTVPPNTIPTTKGTFADYGIVRAVVAVQIGVITKRYTRLFDATVFNQASVALIGQEFDFSADQTDGEGKIISINPVRKRRRI